jgi:hypothetical protein
MNRASASEGDVRLQTAALVGRGVSIRSHTGTARWRSGLTAVRHIDPVPNPGSGVLVGRDGELAALRAGFETALSGRPTIILLMGEAGIGKTRLADEATLLARASGTRVLRGEADALSREPMELWRGVYRALGIQPVGVHPYRRRSGGGNTWNYSPTRWSRLRRPSWSSRTCTGLIRLRSGCSKERSSPVTARA